MNCIDDPADMFFNFIEKHGWIWAGKEIWGREPELGHFGGNVRKGNFPRKGILQEPSLGGKGRGGWNSPIGGREFIKVRDSWGVGVQNKGTKNGKAQPRYSLNVAPRNQPIFWSWVSKYPTKKRALAPLLCKECVLI